MPGAKSDAERQGSGACRGRGVDTFSEASNRWSAAFRRMHTCSEEARAAALEVACSCRRVSHDYPCPFLDFPCFPVGSVWRRGLARMTQMTEVWKIMPGPRRQWQEGVRSGGRQ